MKATFTIDRMRRREMPKGGRLAAAQARLAAAEKASSPGDKKHKELNADRERIVARIGQLDDPKTVAELRELEDLKLQLKANGRQIEELLGPGAPHAVAAEEHGAARREVAYAEGDLDRVRRKIAELFEQLGPLLHDAYTITGNAQDLHAELDVK